VARAPSSLNSICLLLILTLAFTHPFSYGYDPAVVVGFIAWMTTGLCIAICCAELPKEQFDVKRTIAPFVVFTAAIALRQGPLQASLLGAIITLTAVAAWAVCASLIVQSKPHLKALISALIIAALFNAVVALYQYFGWAEQYLVPFIRQAEAGRALGQLNQRNLLAFLCVLGLAALVYNAQAPKDRWTRWAWATVAVGIVLTAAVAATASRSGAISLAVLCLLVFLSRRSVPVFTQRITLCFAVLYVVFSFLLPWIVDSNGLFDRLAEEHGGCHSRLVLWSNALAMIKEAPWLGHGWGSFLYVFYNTGFESRFCEPADHAHNMFLQLAAELGVPFALGVGVYCVWLLVSKRKALVGCAAQQTGYCIVVLGLIYSQTEYPLWNADFLALFSMGLGLLFTVRDTNSTQDISIAAPMGYSQARLALSIIGSIAFLAGGVGFYQYNRVSQLSLPTEMRDADIRNNPQQASRLYWAFANQLSYVRIHNVKVTPGNAKQTLEAGLALLKFAPAPMVLIRIIECAKALNDKELETFHMQRFMEIYPDRYIKWRNSLVSDKFAPTDQIRSQK
jgi:O-antigen polymerase